MVQSAPIGTNPIVYFFAHFYFEVVIQRRLSKCFQMSCIRLPEHFANIVQTVRRTKLIRLFFIPCAAYINRN